MKLKSCIFLWRDKGLFVGVHPGMARHDHHAVEICVALAGTLRVQVGPGGQSADGGELVECGGVVLRPDVEHEIAVTAPQLAIVYIEPSSPEGVALCRVLGDDDARRIPDDLLADWRPRLLELVRDSRFEHAEVVFRAMFEGFFRALGQGDAESHLAWARGRISKHGDHRITRVKELIVENIDRVMPGTELARAVGLSPGRLRHLFREVEGVSMRRYALWMRLRRAVAVAMSGRTLTDAAHEAGFSDASHLTRTCRQLLGLTPTGFIPIEVVIAGPDWPAERPVRGKPPDSAVA